MQTSRLLPYRQLWEKPLLIGSVASRGACLCAARAVSAVQWLQSAATTTSKQDSCGASLSSTIIHQADSLEHARKQRSLESASSCDSMSSISPTAASTATSPFNDLGNTAAAGIVLREQQLQFPPEFAAPAQTSVPVHQLVAVFTSMLGAGPVLHKDARVGTMEAKWRLLQLLLLRHQNQHQQLGTSLEQLLQLAFKDAVRRLGKVMSNDKIPELNKQQAQEQFERLWTNCHDTISDWVETTVSSPNFAVLQPAMSELASSIDVAVLLDDTTAAQPDRSAQAGKLMEAAAVQAVRDALPEGWTLLTSLHLVGVDGQCLTTTQRGCKFEADMLVLDQQGVAVAIIEVKLAAANPLMALVNDVSNLLRLVDRTAGKALTCLTKSDDTAAAAAAAAAAHSSSGAQQQSQVTLDPELHSKLANMTARAPFSVGPSWHILHVPVHWDILPVYVLGNDISGTAVTRGLNSLVSSSTLKLLYKSPTAIAAALEGYLQQRRRDAADVESAAAAAASSDAAGSSQVAASKEVDSRGSVSSDFMDCRSDSGSSFSSLLLEDDAPIQSASIAAAADQQQQPGSGAGRSTPVDAAGRIMQVRTESSNSFRARIRAQLQLDAQQQQVLTDHIWGKLNILQDRCRIYSLVKEMD